MNANPEINVVVFEIERQGGLMRITGTGPTRSANCIQTIWAAFQQDPEIKHDLQGDKVRRVYSEWEPSPDDLQFLTSTFPSAKITCSFERPPEGQWDRAMKQVTEIIGAAELNC
jgi:hypothetical protein